MTEYEFHIGQFYFSVISESDKQAVTVARRALKESFPEDFQDHINIDLTAGAFKGRLYIIPGEITTKNICRRIKLPLDAKPF